MSATVTTSFDDDKARAIGWLTAWDSQGTHRTATSGDQAGGLWLADEAAELGAAVTSEAFPLVRLDPVAYHLDLDGKRISGVPAFDTPAAGDDGVTGRLSLDDREQGIVVAELRPQSVYIGQYDRLQRSAPHRALVIVCTGTRPGMGPLNAERFRNPYAVPALHLSSVAREAVLTAATRGATARVIIKNRYSPATASNVVVEIRGRDRTSPPLVVVPGGNQQPSGVAALSVGSKRCVP